MVQAQTGLSPILERVTETAAAMGNPKTEMTTIQRSPVRQTNKKRKAVIPQITADTLASALFSAVTPRTGDPTGVALGNFLLEGFM